MQMFGQKAMKFGCSSKFVMLNLAIRTTYVSFRQLVWLCNVPPSNPLYSPSDRFHQRVNARSDSICKPSMHLFQQHVNHNRSRLFDGMHAI